MTFSKSVAALLAAAILATPAMARDEATIAQELATMRAKIDSLEAEVAALKRADKDAPAPVWKGAPQLESKASGFSFKPKGLIQFDTGSVNNPGNAVPTSHLGFNTRTRRLILGAEGSLPGGFGYRAEFNLVGGTVDYEDVVLTYAPKSLPIMLTLGNSSPLSSLETMTSARVTSFHERAQATDAFGYGRRLGAVVALLDPAADRYTLTAGLYGGTINGGFNNDGWQASVRGTFAPRLSDSARLHFGVNYQHRVTQTDDQAQRYRARPFTQITDIRFVDTGAIAAKGDDILGMEVGGIFGPLHVAAEAQKLWLNTDRPGVGGGIFVPGNLDFSSGYVEIGYFLTGESRGYKGGKWDGVKVARPVGTGGLGAVQLNARIDYLDLTDRTGGALVNGGRQLGYQASAIWNPTDYVRFVLQYAHNAVTGGPLADTVDPLATLPVERRDYRADSVALRAQVEF